MKILLVVPSLRVGGAEIVCTHLACRLVALGHDVCVAYMVDFPSPLPARLEAKGVKAVCLGKKLGIDFGHLGKLRKVIKDFKPDVIHTQGNVLKYVAMSSFGLPVKGFLHTIHSIADKEAQAIDLSLNRILFRKKKVVVVALSERIRQSVEDVYGAAARTRGPIPVIGNGIPLPAETPVRDYAFGDSIRIVLPARYSAEKNHLALIEAVVALHAADPRVRLELYGEGPLKERINAFIRDNEAEDYIFDRGMTDDVPGKLAEADICVLPSTYEGTPMVLIEAMASALPIVASRVGGIPDMLAEGKEALLCTPDAADIRRALAGLIADEALRRRLGQAAFARSADFSDERMARQYDALYKSFE